MWRPEGNKIKVVTMSLHRRNSPVTFCFHLWALKSAIRTAAEHCTQPHAAYLRAAAWWKTGPAYSTYTSHPHLPPLPSPLHLSLILPAVVAADAAPATAAATRGNLHFNRQSCSPSPNEGMCSGKQQETHPAAQVSNEPSRRFLSQRKWYFSHWASLSAAHGRIYINIQKCIFHKTK